MKRTHFVKWLGLAIVQPAVSFEEMQEEKKMLVPPFLQPGDTIGICSPAGYISRTEINACVEMLKSWGFAVKVGSSIGMRWNTFGGTDEERLTDFQDMLNDISLAAILCARGGYGMVRIIDRIDFSVFRKHPKWVLGFSDITVFHAHVNRVVRIASMHCKMCNSFPDNPAFADEVQIAAIQTIRENLLGKKNYVFSSDLGNREGIAEAELVGGNLKTIETLSGTVSDLRTDGKILFVEDTGEYLYSIDRMFWHLLRTGKLKGLSGLIIGGMKIRPDDPGEEFGMTLKEIVFEKVKDFDFPVSFGLPAGHQKNNVSLKCGVKYRLMVNSNDSELIEL